MPPLLTRRRSTLLQSGNSLRQSVDHDPLESSRLRHRQQLLDHVNMSHPKQRVEIAEPELRIGCVGIEGRLKERKRLLGL